MQLSLGHLPLPRFMAVAAAAAAFVTGCGGDSGTRPDAANAPPTRDGLPIATDAEYYQSNVKYDLIEIFGNRGAAAPVVLDFSCDWSSATVADCTGLAYDHAPDLGSCGYPLLPCGRFHVSVHAECADSRGHGCEFGEIGIEGGKVSPAEPANDASQPSPPRNEAAIPEVPNTTERTTACGSTSNGYGRFRVFVVSGEVSCGTARAVVASTAVGAGRDALPGWTYYDWTKGGNGPWSDVWSAEGDALDGKVVAAILQE